uniref:Uncharacterized protein n=1 Tax=Strongyloides venezuelensis TaxID=75913 RepID=A0A0K0EU10_STRVS
MLLDNDDNSIIVEVHTKFFTYDNQIYDCKFTDTRVGNKSDLNNTSRVVTRDEGALMAKKFNDAAF